MTELEELLHDSVNAWLTNTLVGVDGLNKKCVFYLNPNGGTIGTSADMFIEINGQYRKLNSEIPSQQWFRLLEVICKPRVDIYNHQQKFWYLLVSDVDGNITFTYEDNHLIEFPEDRFIVWEYDEFGINDRTSKSRARVLDEYRPLN